MVPLNLREMPGNFFAQLLCVFYQLSTICLDSTISRQCHFKETVLWDFRPYVPNKQAKAVSRTFSFSSRYYDYADTQF